MIGKLLKYEFKSTGRIYLPLYIGLLGVSIILKLFFSIETNFKVMILPKILLGFLYAVLIIAVFVLSYVMTCVRFYKNLLGNEGYLMHTLPVQPYKHVWAKLITASAWMLSGICISVLSVIILALRKDLFKDINKYLSYALESTGLLSHKSSLVATIIAALLFFSIACLTSFLMFYASMSVGQLLRGHKIIGAIVAYFGFYTIGQIISLITVLIMSRTSIWQAIQTSDITVISSGIWNPITVFCFIYICINTFVAAGYYTITIYMLRKKLNLE